MQYISPKDFLFNLHATSPNEAKRIWRKMIKDKWNNTCAYCGSEENLTIDHVIPQAKGGHDFTYNAVCCCEKCNRSKSHEDWEIWFSRQEFFTIERKNAILEWVNYTDKKPLYKYGSRKNKVV